MNTMNTWTYWIGKFTSRKFLLAAGMVIAGLVAMFSNVDTATAQTMVEKYMAYIPNVIGAIVTVLGALGFIKAEAAIDAARAAKE